MQVEVGGKKEKIKNAARPRPTEQLSLPEWRMVTIGLEKGESAARGGEAELHVS